MAARLIVLDGSQHSRKANVSRDEARTRWLERQGFRVIRVWNNEISQNISGVLEKIYAEIHGSRDAGCFALKHRRRQRFTPPRALRARPSPSRGG
jgi:very-short-patch-repair endonuclease